MFNYLLSREDTSSSVVPFVSYGSVESKYRYLQSKIGIALFPQNEVLLGISIAQVAATKNCTLLTQGRRKSGPMVLNLIETTKEEKRSPSDKPHLQIVAKHRMKIGSGGIQAMAPWKQKWLQYLPTTTNLVSQAPQVHINNSSKIPWVTQAEHHKHIPSELTSNHMNLLALVL